MAGATTDRWAVVARDVVTVRGPDAERFLHSQVSQDVTAIGTGASRWTLVLAPNGRVDALARIRRHAEDEFRLDTEAGFGEVLGARLDRFRIRVKAELEQSTVELAAPLGHPGGDGAGLVGWWDVGAWLDSAPAAEASGTFDDYEAARVAAGWPSMGSEIVPGERIAAELGVSVVAVSFTKGCYPGQELVERMDSRGSQAPRQLRRLDVGPGAAPGDPILDPDDPGAAPVGELTSVAGGRALGYVRRGSGAGQVPAPTSS